MASQSAEITANPYQSSQAALEVKAYTYDRWMESVGIPIHRGFFIEDLRTVELGWWEESGGAVTPGASVLELAAEAVELGAVARLCEQLRTGVRQEVACGDACAGRRGML